MQCIASLFLKLFTDIRKKCKNVKLTDPRGADRVALKSCDKENIEVVLRLRDLVWDSFDIMIPNYMSYTTNKQSCKVLENFSLLDRPSFILSSSEKLE